MSEQLSSDLRVGDVVELLPIGIWNDGMEATIVGYTKGIRHWDKRSGSGFALEIEGSKTGPRGQEIMRFPDELRKKRPPREDLQIVRWADVPWQPVALTTREGVA